MKLIFYVDVTAYKLIVGLFISSKAIRETEILKTKNKGSLKHFPSNRGFL